MKKDARRMSILLHGSGGHSSYFLPLASYISEDNLAVVYTPDLRGRGANPEPNVTRLGAVAGPEVRETVGNWLKQF